MQTDHSIVVIRILKKGKQTYLHRVVRLPAVGALKRYSNALEYEYRVKIAALGTLK
jgi:hypothetical protein